ncbi:hypothetical protein [Streptomyces griseosporeus]
MPDYTLGDSDRTEADDLLDQMLTAAQSELLTAIAAQQARHAGRRGDNHVRRETQAPDAGLSPVSITHMAQAATQSTSHMRSADDEDNAVVRDLVKALHTLALWLVQLHGLMPRECVHGEIPIGLQKVAAAVLDRSASRLDVLKILEDVKAQMGHAPRRSGLLEEDRVSPVIAKMTPLVEKAYADVDRLFNPSGDALYCPVSPLH